MGNVYGADVEQLTDLANALDQASGQLSTTRQSVSGKVQQSAWVGPVADRFRSDWSSTNNSKLASAAQLLSDAATVIRRNAADQTAASSADSVGSGVPRPGPSGTQVTPASVLNLAQSAVNQNIPGLPWSWGQIGGFVPGAGQAISVLAIADSMANGHVPVNQMIDVGASTLRGAGADDGNVYAYGAGVAVGVWNTVWEQASTTDFSAATFSSDMSYIDQHPLDALEGATDAVVAFIPNLISDFTF